MLGIAWVPLPDIRRWLALAAALVVLNLALTFHNVWPTLWVTYRHELSIEIALLLLALLAYHRLAGSPSRRLLGVLAVLLTLLTAGRYADVTASALYGRPINLYWDVRHAPTVLLMLASAAPPWQVAAAGGVLLLVASVFGALHWALGRVAAGLAVVAERRMVALVAGASASLYLAGLASPRMPSEHWFSLPVTPLYARQAGFIAAALFERAGAESLPVPPASDSDLAAVAGADVVVMFLESYGATAYDNPDYATALAPSRQALATAVAASGRQAASALVRSPTFGGASWLAHASFLSGIEVADHRHYALLLTQRRDTLAHRFARHGYRPVAVMPGLRQAWPEGAYYGFAQIYDADGLEYRGPELGFWRIPDQYALAKLDHAELGPSPRSPRFVFFPTISSHLPFRPTPPYQPDWQRVLTADAFDAEAYQVAIDLEADFNDLGPAYLDALDYAYRCLAGYLRLRPGADQVLIVLGDHQPAASVSGEGAGWEVPVHLITNRHELVQRLLQAGFSPGLSPRRPAYAAMHELTGLQLRVFDGGSAAPLGAKDGVDIAGGAVRGHRPQPLAQVGGTQPAALGEPVALPR